MDNKKFSFRKDILNHIVDLSGDYDGIVTLPEIDFFESVATLYDQEYINQLISQCVNWTMKKDWDDKYQQKLKRDEIKVLERVKYRVDFENKRCNQKLRNG